MDIISESLSEHEPRQNVDEDVNIITSGFLSLVHETKCKELEQTHDATNLQEIPKSENENNVDHKEIMVVLPGNVTLHSSLAKLTSHGLYVQIGERLQRFLNSEKSNCEGAKHIDGYLSNIHDYAKSLNTNCDITLTKLLLGYHAASRYTNNATLYRAKIKLVKNNLESYEIENPNLIEAIANIILFLDYIYYNKIGKAYECLQSAKACIEKEGVSIWNVDVLDIEGAMNLILANIRPKLKAKYNAGAFLCYSKAVEKCVQPTLCADDISYKPVIYLAHMAYIKLDMPSPGLLVLFNKGQIILQHGKRHIISEIDIETAESLLNAAKEHLSNCIHQYKMSQLFNGCIIKGEIYLQFRRTQFLKRNNFIKEARESISCAASLFNKWKECCSVNQLSSSVVFEEQIPVLIQDLADTLQLINIKNTDCTMCRRLLRGTIANSTRDEKILCYEREQGKKVRRNMNSHSKYNTSSKRRTDTKICYICKKNYSGDNESGEKSVACDESSPNEDSHESEEF